MVRWLQSTASMRSSLVVASLLLASAGTAAAGPIATAFTGGVVGGGDALGGALGGRVGWRAATGGWAGHVEAAAVRYAGFGPHSGARGYHGAVAVQRQTADRRVHAFVGAAVEGRTARAEDTGAEEQLTTVGPIVGAGLSVGPVQLELSLAVPLGTLDHTGDPAAEVSSGAQLMLAVGVGLP